MLLKSVFALEALDTTRSVDQALLPGVKRMTVGANLDVHLWDRRASLESVTAGTCNNAAVIFGMDFGFHLLNSNHAVLSQQGYHPRRSQTIDRLHHLTRNYTAAMAVIATFLVASPALARSHQKKAPIPLATATPATGFAPDSETLFAPILELAPPGPGRAARAIAIADRQLDFERKISFHPEFSAQIKKVLDQLPPRQGTVIRAASLYSHDDIPWNHLPGGAHQISAAGGPDKDDYLYVLTEKYTSPETPQHMAGDFTLRPSPGSVDGSVGSVDGRISGELLMDTYGAGDGLDFMAAALRYIHGDLKPPWDTVPGVFNHHDIAVLERVRAEMPTFMARLEHYVKFDNVLDEFAGSGNPIVLVNIDAEINAESLKPFPQLYEFYRSVGPVVVAESKVFDQRGNYWMLTEFDRGRMRVTFMVRDGLVTPFDKNYQPAGESLDLARVSALTYRISSSATITRLGMTFGLDNLDFTTDLRRDGNTVETTSTMETVPALVAPPGIHKIIDLIAGDFLQVFAQGNGGFKASFSSHAVGNGLFYDTAGATAELNYSPALEFLARIGDSVAEEHSQEVKIEERKFGEELFDAFMTDYNNARPRILALDGTQGKAQ